MACRKPRPLESVVEKSMPSRWSWSRRDSRMALPSASSPDLHAENLITFDPERRWYVSELRKRLERLFCGLFKI